MKIVNIDEQYILYGNSLQVYDQLPAKTYMVSFSQMSGFFLEEHSDMEVNERVYGVHAQKVEKVMRSFSAFTRNLGVILSGNKGIGKIPVCQAALYQSA